MGRHSIKPLRRTVPQPEARHVYKEVKKELLHIKLMLYVYNADEIFLTMF
jgi:hypothetical protein